MTLTLRQVSKVYSGTATAVAALDRVSLEVPAGRFVAIRGPSGCGKTTLLLTAGTMLAPDQGTVVIAGVEPYEMNADDRARFRAGHIGFVFQQFHLIPYLNLRDNVLASNLTQNRGPGSKAVGHNRDDARARVEELLDRFGLADRAEHHPAQLSTGERQRCALARALFPRPALLLADEPTGNLDAENATIVLSALREFANGGGAVLLVTHDAVAANQADEIIEMRSGSILPGTGRDS